MRYYIFILIIFTSRSNTYAQPTELFSGGDGNGSCLTELSTGEQYLTQGGNEAGYALSSLENTAESMYKGSTGDGYALLKALSGNNYLHSGGPSEGYDLLYKKQEFIWTGAIGTGWTVSGNWNFNVVPDISRPVIIPDGVPNWPYVNAGLFSIGDNPSNGLYKCASLWIQEDALLVTRVNNRVENFGIIIIDGEMRVKKTTADAFQNFEGGTVIINTGGELIIKP